MSDISSLSILLITRERHSFLARILQFLAQEKCPYQIFVADASSKEFFFQAKELNLIYHRFDPEVPYVERALQYLEKIKTPYVVLLGDDDFINLLSLPKICDYLDKNPQCVAVDGQEVKIFYDEHVGITHATSPQPLINGGNAQSRIEAYCSLYWPTFYCVHRTPVLLNSFNFMKKIEELGGLVHELGAAIATIMQGTYHNVPDLYLIRQNAHPKSAENSYPAHEISWKGILKRKDFKWMKKRLVDELFLFSKKLNNNDNTSKKDIEKALNIFFQQEKKTLIKIRKQEIQNFITGKIKAFFPNWIVRLMRKIILSFRSASVTPTPEYVNNIFYKKVENIIWKNPYGNEDFKNSPSSSYVERLLK